MRLAQPALEVPLHVVPLLPAQLKASEPRCQSPIPTIRSPSPYITVASCFAPERDARLRLLRHEVEGSADDSDLCAQHGQASEDDALRRAEEHRQILSLNPMYVYMSSTPTKSDPLMTQNP